MQVKDYYKEKLVSNSSLSWFQISPQYFKRKWEGLEDEGQKSYFQKGQMFHSYILEPETFDDLYVSLDYEVPKSAQQKKFCENFARYKKGKKDEKLVRAYKDAYTTKESDDKVLDKAKTLEKTYQNYIKYIKLSSGNLKTVIPNSTIDVLNEARLALMNHKLANKLMFDDNHSLFGNTKELFIQNELSIYWEHPEFKLACKSMLDRVKIDHENKEVYLIDLKTTSHLSEFKDKAKEYKYHRQLAFYWTALWWYFKNELEVDPEEYTAYTYIVVLTTQSPVQVKVFKVKEPTLREGLLEIEKLMSELKWHFENNKWDHSRSYYDGDGSEIL